MNKKLETIIKGIYSLKSSEVDSVVDAVKLRRNQLHTLNAHSFRIGDTVFFRGRRNTLLEAKVEKIKIKYVLVRTLDGTRWNVPGSHLSTEAINA
jgi:hypothetical protein